MRTVGVKASAILECVVMLKFYLFWSEIDVKYRDSEVIVIFVERESQSKLASVGDSIIALFSFYQNVHMLSFQ